MGPRSRKPTLPAPSELFHPLPQHHVVVCTQCKYAVAPRAIPRHLKDIHRIYRSQRTPFVEFASKFDLCEPADVPYPADEQFPVPALPIFDGLQCTSVKCGYLCVAEKRMQSHWRLEHASNGIHGKQWKEVPLQTFFRGNLLRYFTGFNKNLDASRKPMTQLAAPQTDVLRMSYFNLDHAFEIVLPMSAMSSPCLNSQLQQPLVPLTPYEQALLQHYQSSTSRTMAADPDTQHLWAAGVVQVAFQYDYLMQALLALSALHLAHKADPPQQQEFFLIASRYQDNAMPPFRKAVSEVDESNCHAILAFTHLLVLYSFATEQEDEKLLLVSEHGGDITPRWLHFLRSGCTMLCSVWDVLGLGPCKLLASAWDKPLRLPKAVGSRLESKLQALMEVMPSLGSNGAWSEDECIEYREAASHLTLACSCSEMQEQAWSIWDVLKIWPMRLSERFMRMLAASHPGALILLAHYSVLLKDIEDEWFFKGRATRMIRAIVLRLDPEWRQYITKALEAIEPRSGEMATVSTFNPDGDPDFVPNSTHSIKEPRVSAIQRPMKEAVEKVLIHIC